MIGQEVFLLESELAHRPHQRAQGHDLRIAAVDPFDLPAPDSAIARSFPPPAPPRRRCRRPPGRRRRSRTSPCAGPQAGFSWRRGRTCPTPGRSPARGPAPRNPAAAGRHRRCRRYRPGGRAAGGRGGRRLRSRSRNEAVGAAKHSRITRPSLSPALARRHAFSTPASRPRRRRPKPSKPGKDGAAGGRCADRERIRSFGKSVLLRRRRKQPNAGVNLSVDTGFVFTTCSRRTCSPPDLPAWAPGGLLFAGIADGRARDQTGHRLYRWSEPLPPRQGSVRPPPSQP